MPLFALLAMLAQPLGAQATARYELEPEQRTGAIHQIWVVCHSHLDIGFTRPPDEVARDYKDNIDSAIRLAREHDDFRWTIESTWMLEQWLLRTADPAAVEELGRLMRAGRIALGAAFANMHSGLMAPEESNRLVALGQQFRARFGIDLPVAFQNDVPGFTWAYPRVLAGSGVKYLVTGLNLFIGGGNNLGMGQDPFYWTGPDGSRVLTWFAYDSYVEGYRWHLRGGPELAELEQTVPRRLAWLEHNGYPYDTYLMMASPGDNADPAGAYRILERIRAWNGRHPELPMKMVTAEEFFRYLTSHYVDRFPSAAGDATGHWEIVKLKVPEAAGRIRQAANLLPAVETAATVATWLKGATFPRYDFADAWRALLVFHEHTADAGPGWPGYFSRQDTDWSNTAHYAAAISGFSNTEQLLRKTLDRLGPGPGTATLLVFNGLSWGRSGAVLVEHLPAELREGPLAIVDLASGEMQPYEDVPGTRRQIIFLARDVPAAGYRLYGVGKGTATSVARGEFGMDVKLDDAGGIVSFRDRRSGKEIVPPPGGRKFGSLWLARGRGGFQPADTGPATVKTEEGAVARRIEIMRPRSALPRTVITTYRGEAYLDLRFEVDLGFEASPENRQFALALPVPKGEQMLVDGAGFVIRVPQDLLPGGGAPRFTPVHFTHLRHSADWGITLANRESAFVTPDLLFPISAESRTTRTRDEGPQELSRTEPRGTPIQTFHFRIAGQTERAWEWERLGAELNLPLRAVLAGRANDPAARSYFELNRPEVQLLTAKPAESQAGWYVLRFQEIAGTGAQGVRLTTPFKIVEAVAADTTERPLGKAIDLDNFRLGPWQTLTVLVR